jgi:hypothetical protein
MSNKETEKKTTKSISGLDCKGPCYFPGVEYIHPVSLNRINVPDKATCPTIKHDNPDKPEVMIEYDTCLNPTHKKNSDDILLDIISPLRVLHDDVFLKTYYDIYSIEDAIVTVTNNTYLRKTNNRLINMALRAYGDELIIIDHRIVNIIKDYLVYNISDISKYIGKIPVNTSINKNDNTNSDSSDSSGSNDSSDSSDNSNSSDKYIINVFLTDDNIIKFMTKYIENNKNKWNYTENHLTEITKEMTIYIKHKKN